MKNAKLPVLSSGRQFKIKRFLNKLRKEISLHKTTYLILFLIILVSAFFRLYKLDKLLGFWYDQGRDALVIWDLLHYKKLFLIGPVTGIEGIFLGPFYYYLIAPFYWLGQGSPVFVAAFLSWLSVGTIFLIYYLTSKIYTKEAGLLAAFFYGFSYEMVTFSRWLANPNPLPFFTLLTLIFLWLAIEKNERYLILASFVIGLCLQLEAAAAIFFLPAVLVIILWQREKLLKQKLIFSCFILFFITLLPQIIFNFRHQGVLFEAFKRFLVSEGSFRFSLFDTLKSRLILYYEVTFKKLFPYHQKFNLISLVGFCFLILKNRQRIFNEKGKLLLIWLLSPLIGFLFYQGNFGYIWDYYFTGILPIFMIFLAAGLFFLGFQKKSSKFAQGVFLLVFLFVNLRLLKSYYKTGVGITLGAELKALDWIYKEAKNDKFNVDVYVPPNICFSYSYLFRWYGRGRYGREAETRLVNSLYTLYEPDNERPFLLEAWLKRQDGIGKIVKSYSWGYVTVQKRERINFDE